MYAGRVLLASALLAAGFWVGSGGTGGEAAAGDAKGIALIREAHRWEIDDDEERLRIKLFVRNDGAQPVEGTVVVRIVLLNDGLEHAYLEETARVYGPKLEEELRQYLADAQNENPRSRAILSYLERGRKLPEGKTYEPCAAVGEPRTARIKIPVRLSPGEIKKEVREDWVPEVYSGFRVKAEIESLETEA